MKSATEILNTFGQIVVDNVYDDGLRYFEQIITNSTKWGTGKDYSEVFAKLDAHDKKIVKQYIKDLLSTSIFAFLSIFEENHNFKIIYEENAEQVDLSKISEMLKSEPIIENGWIERFSKE